MPGTRLRADDKSCPLARVGQREKLHCRHDESSWTTLRPIREPEVSAQWHAVGGPLPVVPGALRRLFAGLPSLHRTQPRAGWNGRASGRLSMVELPR
jgi:hypothetical protein